MGSRKRIIDYIYVKYVKGNVINFQNYNYIYSRTQRILDMKDRLTKIKHKLINKIGNNYSLVRKNTLFYLQKYKGKRMKIELKNMEEFDSVMENITLISNKIVEGIDNDDQLKDLTARFFILSKVADLYLKKYDAETKRILSMSQMAKTLNENELLKLEAAIVSGDKKYLNSFVNNNTKQIKGEINE